MDPLRGGSLKRQRSIESGRESPARKSTKINHDPRIDENRTSHAIHPDRQGQIAVNSHTDASSSALHDAVAVPNPPGRLTAVFLEQCTTTMDAYTERAISSRHLAQKQLEFSLVDGRYSDFPALHDQCKSAKQNAQTRFDKSDNLYQAIFSTTAVSFETFLQDRLTSILPALLPHESQSSSDDMISLKDEVSQLRGQLNQQNEQLRAKDAMFLDLRREMQVFMKRSEDTEIRRDQAEKYQDETTTRLTTALEAISSEVSASTRLDDECRAEMRNQLQQVKEESSTLKIALVKQHDEVKSTTFSYGALKQEHFALQELVSSWTSHQDDLAQQLASLQKIKKPDTDDSEVKKEIRNIKTQIKGTKTYIDEVKCAFYNDYEGFKLSTQTTLKALEDQPRNHGFPSPREMTAAADLQQLRTDLENHATRADRAIKAQDDFMEARDKSYQSTFLELQESISDIARNRTPNGAPPSPISRNGAENVDVIKVQLESLTTAQEAQATRQAQVDNHLRDIELGLKANEERLLALENNPALGELQKRCDTLHHVTNNQRLNINEIRRDMIWRSRPEANTALFLHAPPTNNTIPGHTGRVPQATTPTAQQAQQLRPQHGNPPAGVPSSPTADQLTNMLLTQGQQTTAGFQHIHATFGPKIEQLMAAVVGNQNAVGHMQEALRNAGNNLRQRTDYLNSATSDIQARLALAQSHIQSLMDDTSQRHVDGNESVQQLIDQSCERLKASITEDVVSLEKFNVMQDSVDRLEKTLLKPPTNGIRAEMDNVHFEVNRVNDIMQSHSSKHNAHETTLHAHDARLNEFERRLQMQRETLREAQERDRDNMSVNAAALAKTMHELQDHLSRPRSDFAQMMEDGLATIAESKSRSRSRRLELAEKSTKETTPGAITEASDSSRAGAQRDSNST